MLCFMAIFHFLVTCSVRFCHILRVFYYIYYVSFPIHDNDGGISSSFHTSFVTVPLDGDGRSDTKYVIISTSFSSDMSKKNKSK